MNDGLLLVVDFLWDRQSALVEASRGLELRAMIGSWTLVPTYLTQQVVQSTSI
jgi:hypothetical protein